MPKVTAPTSFTAGRKQTINGTVYNPGDVIPNSVAKSLKNLSALLGNRDIIPSPDPYRRRTRPSTATPTDIGSVLRKDIP
jgi:hypothetical protein